MNSSNVPPSPSHAPRRRLALAFCALLSLLPAASSSEFKSYARRQQEVRRALAPPPAQELDEEVLRVDTDLVLVDVTVTDAAGRPVRGLRPEDFKLYEDNEERPISFFNVERRGGAERPAAVVFAVDVSGSMTVEEVLRLKTAMRAFSKHMEERPVTFAVTGFGMNAKTYQSFTGDPLKLERAVERLARDLNGLSTHTYDAVDDAIRLLVRTAPRTRDRRLMKRAVVVITDGFPVGDTVSPKTVIERANEADVNVYTVTLPSYSRLLAAMSQENTPLPTPLDVSGLVEQTGGKNVYATEKDYAPLFKALAEEVTSAYVLAFYPPEAKRRDGRTHSVRVEAPHGLNIRQSRYDYKSREE